MWLSFVLAWYFPWLALLGGDTFLGQEEERTVDQVFRELVSVLLLHLFSM